MAVTTFFSILFGIVEGLTEFLPISSTAHILLTSRYLELVPTAFFESFTVAIQTGAILAAVVFFRKELLQNKFSLLPKILVGFTPTALVGLLLFKLIGSLFQSTVLIALALIVGGVVMLFIKTVDTPSTVTEISFKDAFTIGCCQILAFIPGISRSGATLIGGTLLGIPRSTIVPFSFLLGIPTIVGAGVVELFSLPSISGQEWGWIAVGTVTSFLIALLSMRLFIGLMTEKPLSWFGWYRIVLGIVVLLFL